MSSPVGERIRRAREREGLTQAALAEKVGVAQPTIAVWETKDDLPEATYKKLEKILGPFFPKRGRKADPMPETQISSFGVWLRDQRSAASMSVPELAKSSGVSVPAIYNIESGRIQNPQALTRDKLAKALKKSVPDQVVKDTEQEQVIVGLGSLTDFDPYSKKDWPKCAGVYVLYDISQRPIYVGKSDNIAKRFLTHVQMFWFKNPIVEYASYIEVGDQQLRHQLEQAMIKFLKSNAVINKQSTESLSDD